MVQTEKKDTKITVEIEQVAQTTIAQSRPLISFRPTPCCELKKVKEISGGSEGDSKMVHSNGKCLGLSEI